MAEARRHHFVPAFYLAQFTESHSQEGELWVFDGAQTKSWKSTPRGTGHERDFNRIDAEGVDPLFVETSVFAEVESLCAPVLRAWLERTTDDALRRNVHEASDTTQEELAAIFTFVAAQAVRVPIRRQTLDQFYTDATRQILELAGSTDDSLDRANAGNKELAAVSRQDLQRLLADPTLRAQLDTTGHLAALLPMITPITELLALRHWGILRSSANGPDFITSDNPILLVPTVEQHPFLELGSGPKGLSSAYRSRRGTAFGARG